MASYYQKAFLEVSSALQQNQEAFDSLHSIYKLPNSYCSLPASATIQAMEMLGVFSEKNPIGLIDLPLVVGLKTTHKKVKNKMKKKFKYPGFNGIASKKPQLEKIMAKIQETFQLLISQLELLDMEIADQGDKGSNQLDNVILAVNDTQEMMNRAVKIIHKPEEEKKVFVKVSQNSPIRFVPKRIQSLPDTQILAETRRDYNPVPLPIGHHHPNQSFAQRSHGTNVPIGSNQLEEFSPQQQSSLERQKHHQFHDDQNNSDSEYEEFSQRETNRLSALMVDRQKLDIKKASPGPPPPTKPKPQRQKQSLKVPIIPPNIATESASKTDSVISNLSESYVRMDPIPNRKLEGKVEDVMEGGFSNSPHDYVNVGSKKMGGASPMIPALQKLQQDPNEATDSENETAFEEYETF